MNKRNKTLVFIVISAVVVFGLLNMADTLSSIDWADVLIRILSDADFFTE